MTLIGDIIWFLYVALIVCVIAVIVHDKREPVRTISWISVVALLPVGGIILYITFGRNLRKRKIFSRKATRDELFLEKHRKIQLRNLEQDTLESNISDNKEIITLMINNSRALLTTHNRLKILNNGSECFPSIIKALQEAKESIHLEYYIYQHDAIGELIGNILIEKARSGVEVRMIYDDVGSWSLSNKFISRLRKAGVELYAFQPVMMPYLTSKVNYRNHRKIVIVDSKVAFTGGINIAERYMRGTKHGVWRDTHLRLEGESVNLLQHVFVSDWFFVSKKQLSDYDKYFPESEVRDYLPMQIASSGPDSSWASIMQAFFAAINKAKDHIYISSPYFLPNEAISTALKVAALSAIEVRVLLPSRSDSKIVYWATRSYIEEMLEAGINVYFYKKGFNHSKVITIDGNFASVGTANMDMRSFEDNFEVTALIYDKNICQSLEQSYLRDLESAEKLSLKKWQRRPLIHNIYESLSRLLSPLL